MLSCERVNNPCTTHNNEITFLANISLTLNWYNTMIHKAARELKLSQVYNKPT